jgi:hypothetical protein
MAPKPRLPEARHPLAAIIGRGMMIAIVDLITNRTDD